MELFVKATYDLEEEDALPLETYEHISMFYLVISTRILTCAQPAFNTLKKNLMITLSLLYLLLKLLDTIEKYQCKLNVCCTFCNAFCNISVSV